MAAPLSPGLVEFSTLRRGLRRGGLVDLPEPFSDARLLDELPGVFPFDELPGAFPLDALPGVFPFDALPGVFPLDELRGALSLDGVFDGRVGVPVTTCPRR